MVSAIFCDYEWGRCRQNSNWVFLPVPPLGSGVFVLKGAIRITCSLHPRQINSSSPSSTGDKLPESARGVLTLLWSHLLSGVSMTRVS